MKQAKFLVPTVVSFDAQGKTLLELSDGTPAVAAVKDIVDKLMA